MRADGNAGSSQRGVRVGDGRFAEMEDRGGEHGGCVALRHPRDEVIEVADAA